MSRTRDLSKLLSQGGGSLSDYLTIVSASTTYATQASLSTIDADNNPDILMNMGG
jgi:hypothetical protein